MYFHGTDKESADKILKTGFMKPSIGDHHWLGDGYYFYKSEEYAFRWILIKYTNNFKNKYAAAYHNIYQEYTILSVQLSKNIRIFSMQDIKNRLFYIRVKNKIKEKSEYFDRMNGQSNRNGIVDGVIFNILFEYMGLDKEYDAIEADFSIMFQRNSDSRLDYLPEDQLCIRNFGVIDKIQKYSGECVPDKYKVFINEYNQSKNMLADKARLYKKRIKDYTKN